METDIILEGFKQEGEQYKKWNVPIMHACKCYRASLEKLVQQNPTYKGRGGLTGKMRQRLTNAARCAIKMHSKELNKTEGLKKLQADLQNGPYHCYRIHDNCTPDFCTTVRENQQQDESNCESNDTSDENADDLSGIAAAQVRPKQNTCMLCH